MTSIVYQLDLPWRGFPVDLPTVEEWVRTNAGTGYVGNSADADLTLWYTATPDGATIQSVHDYWNALTTGSPEATSYLPQTTISAAVATLRTSLIGKTWDSMTVAEQKILAGLMPTRADLGL